MANKEVKEVVRALRKEGFVLYQKGGHIRVRDPKTGRIVMRISSTPGAAAIPKIKAEAKKLGVIV